MAIKKNPTPTVRPTIKGATKPFMAPSFNVPTGPKSNGINMPTGSAKKKKSNVSSGKGIDLMKDKMRANVQKTKTKVRSSTVSRGSGNCGAGNNLCKSNSKF
jgi:hypothetical protein